MSLHLENVTFYYPDQERPVLQGLNLTIEPGEFALIIGPSGCGKTTLLQTIAGIVPHRTGGRFKGGVSLDENNIVKNPHKIQGVVGLVLQDPEAQLVSLYVVDEVAFGPENLLIPREEIQRRIDRALTSARIAEKAQSFVYTLSGGQKQRVAIAAGLAMYPKLLLLDAPTTNLDPAGASEVLRFIEDLRAASLTETVIVTANKIDELLPLATRVIVMNSGEVVIDGTPEEVILDHTPDLEDLGLFVPELGQVFSVLKKRGQLNCAKLPASIQEAAEALQPLDLPVPSVHTEQVASAAPPAVVVDRVSFAYGEGPPVLTDLSLTVHQGESLAVLGQNGCGKTTLMRLIAGLLLPKEGQIIVGGQNTQKVPPLGRVGYVFQYPEHQFVATTVADELRLSLQNSGLASEQVDDLVYETLEQFGLQGLSEYSPYRLSMGQKRRLSVATMAIMKPPILILDEPTTGLDRRATIQLMEIVHDLVAQGTTLVQVTHDMEQVAQFSHRAVVIHEGGILFDGSPRLLFTAHDVLQVARLQSPPVVRLSETLWPNNLPAITVSGFFGPSQC